MSPLAEIIYAILKLFADLFSDELRKPRTSEKSLPVDPALRDSLRLRVRQAEDRAREARGSD